MLKAVIFDMDGVIVDSEPVHFAADCKLLKDRFDIDLDYEYYREFIGSTVKKMWESFRKTYKLYGYTWEELSGMADMILENMISEKGYPEIKGVSDIVKDLKGKGYVIAVASSSSMKAIINNLKTIGILEYFDAIVSGMEMENPKPAPDIFLKAAERLNVNPRECIVIEDSRNGVSGAKAAGMACLGFINPNSGNQDLSEADYLFEDFTNIDEAFIRMVHNHCFNVPWRVMETDRLVIREMSVNDIDSLINIYGHEEITKYTEGLYPREEEIKYIEDYIKNIYGFYEYGIWIVETRDGNVIGRAGIEYHEELEQSSDEIRGELILNKSMKGNESHMKNSMGFHQLGYVIDVDYQGMGYGYEACSFILRYARDILRIDRVYVRIHRDNKKSIRLARKLGFVFDK